jgi:hypothetical protein
MQFLREKRYVAVVVDGQVFTYGRVSSSDALLRPSQE